MPLTHYHFACSSRILRSVYFCTTFHGSVLLFVRFPLVYLRLPTVLHTYAFTHTFPVLATTTAYRTILCITFASYYILRTCGYLIDCHHHYITPPPPALRFSTPLTFGYVFCLTGSVRFFTTTRTLPPPHCALPLPRFYHTYLQVLPTGLV